MTSWTNVPKPTESSVTSLLYSDGTPIGLLLAITQSSVIGSTSVMNGWTDVSKPTSSVWSVVAKPLT